MSEPCRRPLDVCKPSDGLKTKQKLTQKQIKIYSFVVMVVVLFLWYFATANIQAALNRNLGLSHFAGALNAGYAVLTVVIYSYFIYAFIRPSNFSIRISLVIIAVLFAILLVSMILNPIPLY